MNNLKQNVIIRQTIYRGKVYPEFQEHHWPSIQFCQWGKQCALFYWPHVLLLETLHLPNP